MVRRGQTLDIVHMEGQQHLWIVWMEGAVRKRGVEDDSNIFGLSNSKNEAAVH